MSTVKSKTLSSTSSFKIHLGLDVRGEKLDHVEGQWVFGGVERDSTRCFLIPVGDRKASTLIPIIKKYIADGSIIISDCWRAYNILS